MDAVGFCIKHKAINKKTNLLSVIIKQFSVTMPLFSVTVRLHKNFVPEVETVTMYLCP